MLKTLLLIILLFPILNFIHEGGHWIGAYISGMRPKMHFQRVDVGDDSRCTKMQHTIINWGGPVTNYLMMGFATLYVPLAPIGFVMATHRLGPNIWAVIQYMKGKTRFTNDETKQFPENYRMIAAWSFLIFYAVSAIFFLYRWKYPTQFTLKIIMISVFPFLWMAYAFLLDYLDKIFFHESNL